MLTEKHWYNTLIEDCKDIITEKGFESRWALIECYHLLGTRILEDYPKFEQKKIYGEKVCDTVARSLNKSERTVQRAVAFAKKFPSLSYFKEGKNITWKSICDKYLPAPKEEWFAVIVDFSLLPAQYKAANLKLLNKIGNASHGKEEIPGVKWIKKVPYENIQSTETV
jgi:hypothetical protein